MSDPKNNSEKQVPKTGHIYDGIEELDYAPPQWFRALFYSTILFSVVYVVYYILGDGTSIKKEYDSAREADVYSQYEKKSTGGSPKELTEADLKAMVGDGEKKKIGASQFQAKCASCHGAQAQGGIGPNLTDKYWIHGAKLTAMVKTITQGVLDKGMPPWGSVLKGDEIHALAVYIRSVSGSNPEGAKAPQGTLMSED